MISGGGTGGHLSPALAVAQAFSAEEPDAEILLVGRSGGLEERLVPALGLQLETIRVRGLNRDAVWTNLALPALLPAALVRGLRIVNRFRPHVVLGVGGYVMMPCIAAARLRGVPYVLQVSEAGGLANRLARPGAAAACVTFAADVEGFPTPRTVFTGQPLRPGFRRGRPQVPPRRLLVMGGSQGALRLNQAVWEALPGLLERFAEVIHLTGRQGEAEAAPHARPGYSPLTFSDDMPALLAEADLVVCRAGVGTCAELTAVGLPAVLVPGTFGGGHQEKNAELLVGAGAAVRLADSLLNGPTLLETLAGLSSDQLTRMADASARLGRPGAARDVVRVLREVAA
ncbi:MAG: UDP-N-acetylglucosamine--N-acetylmuramyl-(pentapeptide) pyrophosphoryl-undecaprenol N-acetylglucosamine transferase [Candidatus Dormibacteraeota bacterium]|uniref:UDP-N-acetylglucosamine--N-acetylmuramyl-(pentapeptide) pyrophosphoryl-undecaprenol N-acetylglucosamine transferase n=1 Tax=Candidatus Dormiibacter inghamiae TaxID=3127013 RepID=A0A934NEM5_9BACT|nr:UDP-N-acetylglucosamine--N-acetylmuramyl-(pentapeptide) pyrophosphoryl-undecaprenol N-acetylglucosamine transferase [Candidatus Dormibacteraeota bacterium]